MKQVEPPVPQSPRLEEIEESSVVVVWTEPEYHEFYNIRGYVVGFKKFGSGNEWVNESISDKDSRKYSLRNLSPETRYYVNVAAKNTFGIGVATESQTLVTKTGKSLRADCNLYTFWGYILVKKNWLASPPDH